MDIEHAAGEPSDERSAQDAHEAREHEEVRRVRGERGGEARVVDAAFLATDRRHVVRSNASGSRSLEAARGTAIAHDGRDLGAERAGSLRVDQRL
jgi:hypothetical protein